MNREELKNQVEVIEDAGDSSSENDIEIINGCFQWETEQVLKLFGLMTSQIVNRE